MSSIGSGRGAGASGSGSAAEGAVGGSGSGSGGRKSKVAKTAAGSKTDIAWEHGVAVDGNPRKMKCKHCEKIITGGPYRMKHHLAGTQKDVGACKSVPDDIRQKIWGIVTSLQQNLNKKIIINQGDDAVSDNTEATQEENEDPARLFKRQRGIQLQPTINNVFKKGLRGDACLVIASFFYNNAIPFNVAKSEEFQKMCELIARHGIGFKPPSYPEIMVKYLKQTVEMMQQTLEEHRAFWKKKSGCTIMTDGWIDRKKRTILNFLVNSPKGTVFLKSIDASNISKTANKVFKMMDDIVEEVGEENVVQIVTDNAANYKAGGELLMQKRKNLYWTPCAAHCIDLMLEDFEKKIPLHKDTIASGRKITTYIYSRTGLISLLHHFTKGNDLIRPAMTRFATSYLCLGCLNDNKGALMSMFTSKEWKDSQLAKTKDGVFVENVITDEMFWENILNCLRGANPLIRVLRLVNSDEKPAMGFIYEEMDRAKERIQSAFRGVSTSYTPLWEIIDQRWDNQLHRPLHPASYYLNPIFHYSPEFKADYEVKHGLYDCLERIVGDVEEISKIDIQLEDFKSKAKFFGSAVATRALKFKTPAQWWESYGDEHRNYRGLLFLVLSLTCSSSGCERNWSAFEMVGSLRPDKSIPSIILQQAKGLAILTVVKVGVVVTYNVGTGLVVARRDDGSWSPPSAISTFGMGWGAQAGGELIDFIIVLRTNDAVKAFRGNMHVAIGAGLSAAVGHIGRAAGVDLRAGDGGFGSCYSYSCSKGGFVGCSLEGSMVMTRQKENSQFYGNQSLTATDILLGTLPQPPAAAALYQALSHLYLNIKQLAEW